MPTHAIESADRRASRHSNTGFTLLELLVVLAVIGAVLSVMPVLLVGRFDEENVASVSDRLMADLRWTRHEAVASNQPASLMIDGDQDGYVLRPSGQHRRLPEGFRIALTSMADHGGGGISFFPDGTSTGGMLHVEFGSDRYAIDVSWPTGRIRRGP